MSNLVLERGVIGACLVDPRHFVGCDLDPACFTGDRRTLWAAMRRVDTAGLDLDLVLVAAEAAGEDERRRGELLRELTACTAGHTPGRAVAEYVNRLRLEWDRRRVILALEELLASARTADPDGVRRRAHEVLGDAQPAGPEGFVPVADSLPGTVDGIEARWNLGGDLAGLSTGLSDLDRYLGGICPGDLVVIGARPSVGKTALGLNVAAHVARQGIGTVAFSSLEMGRDALNQRLLAGEASVSLSDIRRGSVGRTEWDRLVDAHARIAALDLAMDDRAGQPLSRIRAAMRQLAAKGRLALAIVDYLQLVRPERSRDARVNEIAEITGGLKGLAKELGIPVIALSQLSRESAKERRPPQLSDLRDGGSIEQDADAVVFIHNPAEGLPGTDPKRAQIGGRRFLIVAKNRQGERGFVEVQFDGRYQRFSSAERDRS